MTTIFLQAVSSASSIMTGNTLGRGEREKTYKHGITFVAIAFIIGLIASGVLLVKTPLVIGLFDMTDETLVIAKQLTYGMAVVMIFQAVEGTLTKGVLK